MKPKEELQSGAQAAARDARWAYKMAQDFLRAIPRIFPQRTNWTLVQSCNWKGDESAADFRPRFESLFLRHSGFTETTSSNQFVLMSLFLCGLFPDLSGMTGGTEQNGKPWIVMKFVFWLNTLRVLKNEKRKATKPIALQLQEPQSANKPP